jgi:polyphenol oxidase
MDVDVCNFENHGGSCCLRHGGGLFRAWMLPGSGLSLLAMQHDIAYPFNGSADWIVPHWPAPAHVRAVCTTRSGGVSCAPYASLNLGRHVGDSFEAVQGNRALFQTSRGVPTVFLNQVHGTDVLELQPNTPDNSTADGCFTRQPGLACTVMVADCLPILLCAIHNGVGVQVAAVHAGWRGLVGVAGEGIIESAYKRFKPLALMSSAQAAIKIIAWLGPCIGPTAFEVGDEVRDAFVAGQAEAVACFESRTGERWLADLPALARARLHALGISGVYGNDSSLPWCTVSNPLRFFSHRRDRVSGRQAASIWLR